MTRSLVLCLALAACGGGGDDPPPADSAPAGDAPAATVMSVACGSEVATIESTGGFRFSPNTATISVGQVVKFESGGSHNVVPGAAPTDPGLNLPSFGATGCLMFTAAGTFKFKCQPHASMTGTITVN